MNRSSKLVHPLIGSQNLEMISKAKFGFLVGVEWINGGSYFSHTSLQSSPNMQIFQVSAAKL